MNLKAFPFFDSLQEMRKACLSADFLISSTTRFLPFQIAKPSDSQPIDCINVFNLDGTLYRTIMGNEISYAYHQTPLVDFITYFGATLSQALGCGTYYLEIGGRYSAIFNAVNSVEELLRVEWLNSSNLIDTTGKPLVIYQTGFMQRLFLEAEILSPIYPYAETGNENEYKEFVADFKRVTKQSQFDTLKVPPYLADALGSLPIHSQVQVGPYAEVREIEVTPNWLDYGTGASVNVKFSEGNPVIAMGCAEELELTEYNVGGYTPRGGACGQPSTDAVWQATGSYTCEQANGANTGYRLIEQRDVNPDSATYNTIRTVRGTLDLASCPAPVTYYNDEQSEYVQRNNCQTGYTGSTVLVKVAANTYTSTVSKLDANNKALAQLNAIKQEQANSLGTCTLDMKLAYAGRLTNPTATQSQSCAIIGSSGETAYMIDHFTESGTFEQGQTVYTDSMGTNKAQGGNWYGTSTGVAIRLDINSTVVETGLCAL